MAPKPRTVFSPLRPALLVETVDGLDAEADEEDEDEEDEPLLDVTGAPEEVGVDEAAPPVPVVTLPLPLAVVVAGAALVEEPATLALVLESSSSFSMLVRTPPWRAAGADPLATFAAAAAKSSAVFPGGGLTTPTIPP